MSNNKYCRSGIPDYWQVILVEHFVLAQRVASIRHFLTRHYCQDVIRSMMERFQEGAREEDPGRDGAVTLIDSTLSNIKWH